MSSEFGFNIQHLAFNIIQHSNIKQNKCTLKVLKMRFIEQLIQAHKTQDKKTGTTIIK